MIKVERKNGKLNIKTQCEDIADLIQEITAVIYSTYNYILDNSDEETAKEFINIIIEFIEENTDEI